jgi:hypothetical protein
MGGYPGLLNHVSQSICFKTFDLSVVSVCNSENLLMKNSFQSEDSIDLYLNVCIYVLNILLKISFPVKLCK